jgi:FKBP-type peptidyl-prolyl cis-trans isomerase FkpA
MTPRLALALAVLCLAPLAARAQSLKTDDDKTLYALGQILGGNVHSLGLTKDELAKIKLGFDDAASGKKSEVEMQTWGPKVGPYAKKCQEAASARIYKPFLEKAAKEPGAQSFPSGLIYKKLRDGNGASPSPTSTVSVNYEGTLIDGTVFDSSYKRNEPAEFPLTNVIGCWTEGLQKMKVGEKAQLVCPSSIAYGDAGHPPAIPGGAALVFTVELLSIKQ